MMEEWKSIDGYEVSSLGNVRSFKTGKWKVLKGELHSEGYRKIQLYNNGSKKKWFVHRLVLQAFKGKSDLHCDHLNNNRSDNRIENLEYVTQQENNRREQERRLERDLPSNIYMSGKKFRARICKIDLGSYSKIEEAVFVRDAYVKAQY